MEPRSTIIRKSSYGYTIVPNTLIKDKTLSLRARGLFAYMISFPEDWVFYKSNMHKDMLEGRDAVKNAFDELVRAGWITVVERISHMGRFVYTYELNIIEPSQKGSEPPNDELDESTVTGKPSTVKSQTVTGKPSTVDQSLPNNYNNKIIYNKDENEKISNFKEEDTAKYNEKVDDFFEKSINDELWVESYCRQTSLDGDAAKKYLADFLIHLKSTQEPMIRLQEFRKFATNWTRNDIKRNTNTIKSAFNVDKNHQSSPNPIKTSSQPSLKFRKKDEQQ